LHGNIQKVKCSICNKQFDEWVQLGEEVPVCIDCGGILRPDVVWLGESLPRSVLEKAIAATRGCEVFFSIGTSGMVQPAASLAFAAKNNKALLVEVNIDPTPLTEKADNFL